MAGYIYCMQNDHKSYRKYMKIGYTERSPEIRRTELCNEFHCKFEILWDMHVYEPARAESFLHEILYKCRVEYEFFNIDSDIAKLKAERFFDERWREIEGQDVDPPSLVEMADQDARGFLIEPETESELEPDIVLEPFEHRDENQMG